MKLSKKIFIIYIILLSFALLLKFNLSVNYVIDTMTSIRASREVGAWNINLIPLKTIYSQLSRIKIIPYIVIKNLTGNIIMFVPLGFLLPMVYANMRRFYKTFFAGLSYVLAVEFIQLICMIGYFDIDDIILNIIGISFGYIIFCVTAKIYKRSY